jgi:hypothetical protein
MPDPSTSIDADQAVWVIVFGARHGLSRAFRRILMCGRYQVRSLGIFVPGRTFSCPDDLEAAPLLCGKSGNYFDHGIGMRQHRPYTNYNANPERCHFEASSPITQPGSPLRRHRSPVSHLRAARPQQCNLPSADPSVGLARRTGGPPRWVNFTKSGDLGGGLCLCFPSHAIACRKIWV